jgi:hypothetical protein
MELPLSDYRKMAVAEFDTTKLLATWTRTITNRSLWPKSSTTSTIRCCGNSR